MYEWDDVFVYVSVCLGNGMVYMCDLHMCLTHSDFWTVLGRSNAQEKEAEGPNWLPHWFILPFVLILYMPHGMIFCGSLPVLKTVLLSSFLCTWLWSCHEDCGINCGFLDLWRKRSIISLRPRWEWFLVPSSLDRPFLLYFQPWQRESLLPGFYIPSLIRGFYFPHQLCLEWGISW